MTTLKKFFNETFSKGSDEEAEIYYSLVRIAICAAEMKKTSGLSYREIAKRMGSSSSTVRRILDDAKPCNITVGTLIRFSRACGFKLRIHFEKRKEVKNGSEICADVAVTDPFPLFFA